MTGSMPWSRQSRSRPSKRLGRLSWLAILMPLPSLGTWTLKMGQIMSAQTIRAKTLLPTSQWTRLWLLPLQNPLHWQQFIQTKLAPLEVRVFQWISPRLAQRANAQNAPNHGHARTTWENGSSTKWPLETNKSAIQQLKNLWQRLVA